MPAIERDLYSKYKAHANFVCAYVEEAHATDEWPISSARYNHGKIVSIKQPQTDAERVRVGLAFKDHFALTMPMFVDSPELNNPFEKAYAPWPLRLYVIENGKLTWIAEPKNCTYDASQLAAFLDSRIAQRKVM